jgi:Ser/Thr protein kinase RdoA (MazF antagonist)
MKAHQRELLSLEEVREVSRQFGLRRPIEAEPIGRGSRSSAKSSLRTPGGRFMLKRRAADMGGADRLSFLHAFQLHLFDAGVPVPRVVRTPMGTTSVVGPLGTYELFEWVDGNRWTQRLAEAAAIGAALGSMLKSSRSFVPGPHVPAISYHRAGTFEGAAPAIIAAAMRADPDTNEVALRSCTDVLLERGARAYARVESVGLDDFDRLCVHGDTHPGNALFDSGNVRALLDFDSARLDHRACEAANALVHFGNDPIAGVPPERWRAELDLQRMAALVSGIGHGMGAMLQQRERKALPWLMIESCTLESIVPIARMGRFAHLRADGFLAFIERKTAWIEANAQLIESL